MPDEREFDGELVDQFLRYVRGRGPRPDLGQLSDEDRIRHEKLFQLLEAMADGEDVELPPIEEDPVAIRLGIVQGHVDAAPAGSTEEVPISHDLQDDLKELALRFSDEVEIYFDEEIPVWGHDANGLLPAIAICQTLGENILVCLTARADISEALGDARLVFADRPLATAVALVSGATELAVVVRESHCVRALDPSVGWVEPALPRAPEPLEVALGRYIDQSLARWDEVARLETGATLLEEGNGVPSVVQSVLSETLSRTFKIPAKKRALEELQGLSASPLESVVSHVRSENLDEDQLIELLRSLSDVSKP